TCDTFARFGETHMSLRHKGLHHWHRGCSSLPCLHGTVDGTHTPCPGTGRGCTHGSPRRRQAVRNARDTTPPGGAAPRGKADSPSQPGLVAGSGTGPTKRSTEVAHGHHDHDDRDEHHVARS